MGETLEQCRRPAGLFSISRQVSTMFEELNITTLSPDDDNSTEYTPYGERLETYLVPVLFAIIFIVGVLGNVICVPFVSIIYTLESWPWGWLICRLSETGKDVSIGVSVFTLTALSAERWMTIFKAIIYYFLPLVVISFFYILMARRLLASTREMPGALHGGQGEAQAKARKSVACMVLVFVIVALYCVSGVFRQHFNRYLCCKRSALHPTCSSRLSRTAICETSFRSTQRHRCTTRNLSDSVVISNYDYGNSKKNLNIISRNSAVTIMTIRDTNDFLTEDVDENCEKR
ncbi:Neuropeptide receptor A14 [Operophtera brumata]|uniref:Neuropeptide receptor A14 n=1 Tax=Operophtera brumata TaxID=104452 RepID=A0A0L7LHJ8_OPEBR|nr:Neuropeptide receptor A14 [Operophtera brumata]